MHRIVSFVVIICSLGIILSCSGAANTAQQPASSSKSMEVQKYPSWYPSQKIVSSDTAMHAYATAIGSDSAAAVSKAVSWAKAELKSAVSDRLENIRSEALVEKGSESGLDSSRFMIALRRVDNAVDPLAVTGNTKVKTVEGYDSYRSFAEISVDKDELIRRIGKRLAGYENAWNAMKNSKAFESF